MSDLGTEIYRAIAGRAPTREPMGRDPFAVLERRAGGKAAAARMVGVHPATWRRWANGHGRPSRHSADLITAAIRRTRLAPGREARIRSMNPANIKVSAYQRPNGRFRDKIDGAGMDLRPGTIDRLVDAFLMGATPTMLARVFVASIQDPDYRRFFAGAAK